MSDFSNIMITVCGFGTVCCGAVLLAVFLLMRVTGRAMLLPVFSTLGSLVFGSGGGDYDREFEPQRARPRSTDFRARVQNIDDDFEQAIFMRQQKQMEEGDFSFPGSAPAPQGGQPRPNTPSSQTDTSLRPQNTPPKLNSNPYGVRSGPHSPGRRIRDGRFDRNRGPTRIPDQFHEGLTRPDGTVEPPDDDLLGPAGPPGLRSNPRRPGRDVRRRDRSHDEVFGGMLDESGDGYPDS